jgi:hypothetical protein
LNAIEQKSGSDAVDVRAAIGDRSAHGVLQLRLIMRIGSAALSLAFAGTFLASMTAAQAQTAPRMQTAQASQSAATDLSAQSRRYRRPPTRLRVYPLYDPNDVYPRYFPGRNAVRDCTASYVEEFRPSGTVITPRLNCFWRPG